MEREGGREEEEEEEERRGEGRGEGKRTVSLIVCLEYEWGGKNQSDDVFM